ncbi:MAG: prepilin-type N-terminal cleavage/methylation domain-containing protein [Oscillospiraceae bacterium]|nr:prepilin-type N-terminal cleavage/methylation domain-containing protein [Oscillospiraceae bacterium]
MFNMKLKKNNKGFSLVELIIVIAIMAALVAILAPQYIKYVEKSRNATVETAANEVKTVAEAEVALDHFKSACTITVVAGAEPAISSDTAYAGDTGVTFANVCGGATKDVAATVHYTIAITGTAGALVVGNPVQVAGKTAG